MLLSNAQQSTRDQSHEPVETPSGCQNDLCCFAAALPCFLPVLFFAAYTLFRIVRVAILLSSLLTMKTVALLLIAFTSGSFASGFIPPRFAAAQVCPSSTTSSLSSRSETSTEPPSSSSATSSSSSMPTPLWFQKQITVTAPSRGCHLITGDVMKAVGKDMQAISIGMCNLFIQHTSASLTINENADPDVRTDMETALNRIVPAQWNRDGTFKHTLEVRQTMIANECWMMDSEF